MRKNTTYTLLAAVLIGIMVAWATASVQAALTLNADSVVGDTAIAFNGVATTTYAIGTSTTSGTITIGGEAQTGLLTVGQSSATNQIKIGTGAGATTLDIGSLTGAASTTIKSGTGRIVFVGQLSSRATTTSPGLTAIQSAGAATTTATSNDIAGKVTGGIASEYDGIAFSTTYTAAPVCVASPVDDDAKILATSTKVIATATSVVIYHATSVAAGEWNYFCIKTQ